jgi:Uma2 family endonuclease
MSSETSTKLTYEDYVELPDDGNRYEIIEGELYVNPAPVPRHQAIVVNLVVVLHNHVRQHGGACVLVSPIDVLLGVGNVVQPDVVVITTANMRIVSQKNLRGAPDLVIEVLSDSTRRKDEIAKRKLYDQAGAAEYWIVDPELELVKIYRRVDGGLQRVAEISTETGGAITTPILPGFTLDVREVFDMEL